MGSSGNEHQEREGGETRITELRFGRLGEREKMSETVARMQHFSNQTDRSSGGGGGEEDEVSAEPGATATGSRGGRTRKQQERNKEV